MRYDLFSNCFIESSEDYDKIAIAGSDEDVTWSQLEQRVDALKKVFVELNIPEGHPVIIYGHKEAFFPIAILACISSNIPYIPIDKVYPSERIAEIQRITQAQILINCGNYKLDIGIPVIIGATLDKVISSEPDYSDKIHGENDDPLRYIIFTSGSTGQPKGVQISHSAICSFVKWLDKDFGFSNGEVFINQAPFGFDLSVYELICYLHFGGTLLLNDDKTLQDSGRFIRRLAKYAGSVWVSTPSFAYLYLREPDLNAENLPDLHTFLFCGEELTNSTATELLNRFKRSRVLNTYGPTEATVATTLVDITSEIAQKHSVLPVGYPKRDCQILIDKSSETDEEGEIIIIGNNVSTGYFNDPELNSSKFYKDGNTRAFRTGDWGFYKDEMLFFTGRNDEQVKLHGYRIELGEISSVIRKIDFITDAVTIPLKRGNEVKRIVTFVITDNNSAYSDEELKRKVTGGIEKQLPPYMIPSDIRGITEFPYSANHKIDKLKLATIYTSG